jgi:hypothetical protein
MNDYDRIEQLISLFNQVGTSRLVLFDRLKERNERQRSKSDGEDIPQYFSRETVLYYI